MGRYTHLSTTHPAWEEVSESQRSRDLIAERVYSLPIEEFRKIPYKPAPLPDTAPLVGTDIAIEEQKVPLQCGSEIGIRIYTPMKKRTKRALFYNIHGGGWTVGTPETEEAQNRLVCFKSNIVVVSVDYRKAPEFPFPYALNDSLEVLQWIQRNENAKMLEIDPMQIIIGGGSAGANISAVITQIYRDENRKGIIGQILNIPVTCHPDHFPSSRHEYHSYEQNSGSSIVSSKTMRFFWNNYLPDARPDPRASPLLAATFAHLPPALVQVAGKDPLRDEGFAYAEELKLAGVDVKLQVYPGLPHAFYAYPQLKPTKEYWDSIVDWVDQLLTTVA